MIRAFTAHLIYQAVEKQLLTLFSANEIQRHRRGMEETEVNTPAVKLLSIVTDTKENTEVIGLMFYPSMKSPIKKELRLK
jgi:hypothetical protein